MCFVELEGCSPRQGKSAVCGDVVRRGDVVSQGASAAAGPAGPPPLRLPVSRGAGGAAAARAPVSLPFSGVNLLISILDFRPVSFLSEGIITFVHVAK